MGSTTKIYFIFMLAICGLFGFESKAQSGVFTFECVCANITAPNCDICNTTIQSRYFSGLYIKKAGVGFRWIDAPYIVKWQGNNAVIQEIIPNAEVITINLLGTAFGTLDSFKMAIDCRCSGGGSSTANNGISDNEDGGKIRLGNRYMGTPDAPFTMARKVNVNGRLLHIGDLSDSSVFVVDGANDRIGIRTDAPAKDFSVNGEVRISDLTNGTPDRVVGANSSGDISRLFLSGMSVVSGVLTATDSSTTNELQTIANTSDATSHTATLSNLGGSFKAVEGTGIGLATTGTGLDGVVTVTNTSPDQTVSIAGAGINVVTGTYPTFTVTGTEVDGSISNEGTLGVGAGSGTSSTLLSTTSGANAVTINAAGILAISETTSANGGQITLTATEVGLGTVTSFSANDLSPLFTTTEATPTTTPVLSFALNTQTANTIFSGPTTGAAAAPTFRALVLADVAGLVTANNGLSDNEAGGNIFRLGNRFMNGSDGLFSNDRKVNINDFSLFIGDNSDSTLLNIDGLNGRVGIRTNAPGRAFVVNGEVEIRDLVTTNATVIVGADGSGVLSEIVLGAGLSLTTGILASTAGTNYQTFRDQNVAATVQPNANFLSTATINPTLTNDNPNSETEATFDVVANSIGNTQIRQGVARSLIGVTGNATANVADIQATAGDQVMVVNAGNTAILWATVNTPGITNNAVTNAKFRQGVARSVVGVTGNATADVADIQGTADQVLRVTTAGTALSFGTVATAGIADAAITRAKLANSVALSVIGRSANSAGVPADIAGTADQVLRVSGASVLGFGTVATAGITNSAVTYGKIQNAVADNVLLGNNNGANTAYEEINPAAAQTMLGYVDAAPAGANQRIAYFSDGNTLASEAAFLYDAANDRQTINCDLPGSGAGAAALNITNIGTDATGEFLQIRGNMSANMISGMSNIANTAASNAIWVQSVGGALAGDPMIQYTIAGVTTWSMGLDNDGGDRFKITNAATPGGTVNFGIIVRDNGGVGNTGINKDFPGYPLDVLGQAKLEQHIGDGNAWVVADIAFGAGAGTAPNVTTIIGTNNAMMIRFSTGTVPTAGGNIFTATFPMGFPNKSIVTFSAGMDGGGPGGDNAATDISKFKIVTSGANSFILKANGTLTASQAYELTFGINGY